MKLRSLALALSFFMFSGCSLTWTNRDYPIHSRAGECPTSVLPQVVDTLGMLIALTSSALIYVNAVEVDNPERVYIPLWVISSAFFVSLMGGIGEQMKCNQQFKKENQ